MKFKRGDLVKHKTHGGDMDGMTCRVLSVYRNWSGVYGREMDMFDTTAGTRGGWTNLLQDDFELVTR